MARRRTKAQEKREKMAAAKAQEEQAAAEKRKKKNAKKRAAAKKKEAAKAHTLPTTPALVFAEKFTGGRLVLVPRAKILGKGLAAPRHPLNAVAHVCSTHICQGLHRVAFAVIGGVPLPQHHTPLGEEGMHVWQH